MKKLILVVFLFASTININAQLKVDSIGRTRFSNSVVLGSSTDFISNTSLYTFKFLSSGIYRGIYSKANYYTNAITTTNLTPIFGQITNLPPNYLDDSDGLEPESQTLLWNVFAASVAGVAQSGIGIYGATGSGLPTNLRVTYAGYFNGNVNVTGTLSVPSSVTLSDERLATDISDIKSRTKSLLYKIRPITYSFNANDTIRLKYDPDAQELKNTHFGLLAQELRELYPNLVYENPFDGYLSINYTELIPLLISTIQDQNERITALEEQAKFAEVRKLVSSDAGTYIAKLYQNNPNPFNQLTVISYELPLETQQAVIYIYDMTGTQIDAVNITDFGSGSITLTAGKLQAGMYLYSLIADGKVIDTKQMILTK